MYKIYLIKHDNDKKIEKYYDKILKVLYIKKGRWTTSFYQNTVNTFCDITFFDRTHFFSEKN